MSTDETEALSTSSHPIAPNDMIITMAVIVFHLPAPFGDMNINIPATDIAKPSNELDPTSTTYLKDYRKTILIKVIREIELLLEEEDILEGNEHVSSL
jgi:hypothetical protein